MTRASGEFVHTSAKTSMTQRTHCNSGRSNFNGHWQGRSMLLLLPTGRTRSGINNGGPLYARRKACSSIMTKQCQALQSLLDPAP